MPACSRTLTAGRVQVGQADRRRLLGHHRPGRDDGELLGRHGHQQLGQQRREVRLERDAVRGCIRPAVAIRSAKVCAMSLKARYCSSRAKRMSRASMRARSSSSSGPLCGSSRAALRSSRVAATRRNSVAWDRSHPPGLACSTLMCAMKSSVTVASEISVMSSLCLLIRPEQQVERAGEVVERDLERRGRGASGEDAAGRDVGVLGGARHAAPGLVGGRGHRIRPPHRGR